MATVENKVIIFDDSCPMCRAYTALFVRSGILAREGRTGFAGASRTDLDRIDANRARHEIPLLDTVTGETIYGLDAMIFLVENRFPWLRPIFRIPGLRPMLRGVYRLISYNRRVIVGCPSSPVSANGFDPQPDFSLPWRVTHLTLCTLIGLALTAYAAVQFPALKVSIVVFSLVQVLACAVAVGLAPQTRNRWDYAGSLATDVLLFGALLVLLTEVVPASVMTLRFAFVAAAAIAFLDFQRRLHG